MSLINALYTSFSGLRLASAQMSTVSSNTTNADKAGYTEKTYQSDYTTTSGITVPTGGIVVSTVNKYLYASTISSMSDVGYNTVVSDYLDYYSSSIGSTDGSSTINSALDNFQTALSSLATSPDDSSLKSVAVSAAATLATSLNTLSDNLQTQRLQANQEMTDSINTINTAVEKISDLNKQITVLAARGDSTADLEDERMVALETVSEQMDVQYFITSDNQLKIYTTGGQPLLDSQPHTLSYSEATNVTSETTYPGGFSGVTLNGQDITSSINGGKLGGLIDLRDDILVDEQDKLDEFATTLADSLNTISNAGASYPARSIMTGDTEGISSADSFSATGTLRVATVDSSGTVQSYTDLDLSSYTTVGDLVTALNGLTGVSASLNASGSLVLSAQTTGQGISLNVMDSVVAPDGKDFSTTFGLNNIFKGTGAENIQVSDYLLQSSNYLATGSLSSSATLSAGDKGVTAGGSSTITALLNAFNAKQSFDAAGTFSAQTTTFSSYLNKITADTATRASNADDKMSVAQLLYDQTKDVLQNQSGVNLDEESARLVDLQNKYNSSALMISTIRDLFDQLLNAVS